MEKAYIEEFSRDGHSFMFCDWTGVETVDELRERIEQSKEVVAKYPENSLSIITDVEGFKFDSKYKSIIIDYLEHNRPYVKFGILVGCDGVTKLMVRTLLAISKRKNVDFSYTIEQAIEWVLENARKPEDI